MISSVTRVGFYALLIWVPVPLGSNRPLFWLINAVVVLGLFALIFTRGFATSTSNAKRTLTLLLSFSLLVTAWMIVQAISGTPVALHSSVWSDFGDGSTGAISVNPAASLASAVQFLTIALAGVIAARISLNRRRSIAILRAIVASASIVAVWGFVSIGIDPSPILFGESGTSGDALTSFFVNRNTAATFLALGVAAAMALVMSRLRSSDRGSVGHALAELPRRVGPHLSAVVLLGVALVATGSRAGVLAGAAGLITTFLVGLRRTARIQQAAVGAAIIAVGGAVLLFGTSSDTLFLRLGQFEITEEARWELYRDTVQAILDRPLLGHGAGTFADFFPLYHSIDVPSGGIWLQAHNTFLQAAAELGLPMLTAIVLILFAMVAVCFRAARRRSEPAPIAAVGAAMVVGVHALFDFSLQVEAVAIVFAALLGSGVAVSMAPNPNKSRGNNPLEHRQYEKYGVLPQSVP